MNTDLVISHSHDVAILFYSLRALEWGGPFPPICPFVLGLMETFHHRLDTPRRHPNPVGWTSRHLPCRATAVVVCGDQSASTTRRQMSRARDNMFPGSFLMGERGCEIGSAISGFVVAGRPSLSSTVARSQALGCLKVETFHRWHCIVITIQMR